MRSLNRFSLMLPAIVFVALLISPQAARADNVVITSGALSKGQTNVVNFGFSGVGLSFIGHGSSRARAFRSAIRTVTAFVEARVNEHIREEIESDRDTAA